ncbi:hypothetical protein SCACP_13970 [Sporomusa carbonis]|uniref:hypothetical protein n=1 Tax=Sporomusa carbonis TaxID=3076075 RepID=UPI003A682DE1
MLKRVTVALVIASIVLFLPQGTQAFTLSIGSWQASGSQMWRIAFPGSGASDMSNDDAGVSELYYPQSGNYVTANYEQPLSAKRKLSIEAGILGALTPATGTDSDWDYSRKPDLWYYGTFITSGSSTFFNIDLKQAVGPGTEFFYGYGYSHSKYIMTDGYYSIMDYSQTASSLPDLNSTYSLTYQGPHAGFAATKQLTSKLAMVGSIAYAPLTLVQGRGWWNLRELDFEHTGSGQMLDGKIGLRYNVAERRDNSLTLGYRYQQYSLFTGSENTSPDITWSKAVKTQEGWFLDGNFKF